jgi:hypothetical protein
MVQEWRDEQRILSDAGIEISAGLTETELQLIERVIGCALPPDLRSFLAEGLPIGPGFPDWREPNSAAIRAQLAWPLEGIEFDIEENAFWWSEWGGRPRNIETALALARIHLNAAPRLVPVRGHRYLPAEPALVDNPVFSVYQTDVICYGKNLAAYLRCEFLQLPREEAVRGELREIRFWGALAQGNE